MRLFNVVGCGKMWVLLLLIWAWAPLAAQQLAQYSLYFLDPVQLNPAYVGLDNSLSVTLGYRSQWTGLPGQPVGQRVSAHLPLYILSSGIGLEAEIDEIGARRYSRFGAAYSYQLVSGRRVWSLGLGARLNQLQLDGSQLRTPSGTYDLGQRILVHNDDLLAVSQVNDQQLSFSAGLYYQSERLEGGISALHLNSPVATLAALDWRLERQYSLYLRSRFRGLGAVGQLQPSLFGA
ncbi:MAG: PorP/SprF family type IX secretion system membrane protein [Lewinella sp.]|nr:PorP/SprF family type IX secretion system membrane protein [Lewinella sp.]